MPGAPEPTALLVIRAWRHGTPPVVAARITYTLDAESRDEQVVTAAGVEEIGAVVERWLGEVAEGRAAGDATVTRE